MLFLRKNRLHLIKTIKPQIATSSSFLKDFNSGFSSAAYQDEPFQKRPFIVEYLINSCGFSLNEAAKVSTSISHIRCASKPDSVISFLKQNGFSDANIKRIISSEPSFLRAKVETLEPNLKALQQIGFSQLELIEVVSKNPNNLRCGNVHQKLELLKSIVSSPKSLLRMCKYSSFIKSSLQKTLVPNLSLLKDCGLTAQQLSFAVQMNPRLITSRTDVIKDHIRRTNEYGVPCGSTMFIYLLGAMFFNSKEALDAKLKLIKSFGMSEEQLLSVIRKGPGSLKLRGDSICSKMEFLLKEASCDLAFIADHPVLLNFSLEKRMIPRLFVVKNLKLKGLSLRKWNLYSIMSANDRNFQKKFILPYLSELPDLLQVYTTACTGKQKPISL